MDAGLPSFPPSPTVIPPLPTVNPALYRHSRVSGNPVVACGYQGFMSQGSGFPLTRE